MNKLYALLAAPIVALAFSGTAQALEYVYSDGTVSTRPLRMNPVPVISDQVRDTDLRLGDCLKAHGGRMVPRCAALRDASASIARMENDTAWRGMQNDTALRGDSSRDGVN